MPSVRQRLSYLLALLFVFVSLSPAQAGMTMGRGMVGATIDISVSTVHAAMALNDTSHSDELSGGGSAGHMMPLNMKMNVASMNMSEDDCQSDCDCCPGLCSAFLPTRVSASTFLPANFALADSAFQGKVSTSTRLFRPPISH